MSSSVPDFGTPIVGWRSWLVVDTADGMRLHSTARAQVWRPGEPVRATCRPPSRLVPWPRREPHVAPIEPCTCGVHATVDLTDALATLDPYARQDGAALTSKPWAHAHPCGDRRRLLPARRHGGHSSRDGGC